MTKFEKFLACSALALAAVLAASLLTGCAWGSTANIRSQNQVGDLRPGQEPKGYVVETGWAHYGGCEEAAENALDKARTSARGLGGNVLTNVKWVLEGRELQTPACTTRFFIYYWATTATVSAAAVRDPGRW